MDQVYPSWGLPDVAWQAVVCCLSLEDLLSARLVSSTWRKDLGSFVATAAAIPSQLHSLRSNVLQHVAADDNPVTLSAAGQATGQNRGPTSAQAEDGSLTRCSSPAQDSRSSDMRSAVRALLKAFPHLQTLHIDISSLQNQQLAPSWIDCLVEEASCKRMSRQEVAATCNSGAVYDRKAVWATSSRWPLSNVQDSPRVCLNAIQRSYHCLAQQEYPRRSGSAGSELLRMISHLPHQLTPSGLSSLCILQLDVFPEEPQEWTVLQQLPALRELLLPSFKPALPHHHLPALATLSQLTSATLSVQGSFTSWRSNCDAFASLSGLSRLTSLTLHAFHCPGPQLTAALAVMTGLVQLRLSGRIVLEPLATLHRLTRLQLLELTQDVQSAALCDLTLHLLALQQLAVGRVTLPPAPVVPSSAPVEVWHPAVAANQVAEDADGGVLAAPAAAEAAAVVVAADAGGGAAVAAAAVAADGGEGEVMLEDVGAIVDGLIGNLQEGDVPPHLQRIIERFESIIQLDLTRSRAHSPWGWPVLGLPLLQELQHGKCSGNSHGHDKHRKFGSSSGVAVDDGQNRALHSSIGGSTSSNCGGYGSLELALLRPSDAVRLDELPEQVRCCQHLGLRLRDQLLAFASVSPVRLQPGQLSSLATGFTALQSLSICGKIAIDGRVLCQLTHSLGCSATSSSMLSATAAAEGRVFHTPGLQALSLDCHFVSVSPQQMMEALQHLPALKVLSLRHRGQGKLPLPLQALPAGLLTLAIKKALLYNEQPIACKAGSSKLVVTTQELQIADITSITCHAITSPGFKQTAAAGMLCSPPFSCSVPESTSMEGQTDPVCTFTPPATSISHDPCCSTAAGITAQEQQGCWTGGSVAESSTSMLPCMQSLLLKNCLMSADAVGALLGVAPCDTQANPYDTGLITNCQLTRLSITGDNSSHLDPVDSWAAWLQALKQLRGLQVLDLTVPDCLGSSMPADLLDVLRALPRLLHLHLNTSHQPLDLLALSALHGINTLSVHYSGPPALPSQLLGQLQEGLGPKCSVRLWEMLVLQHVNSFSSNRAGFVDIGDGDDGGPCKTVVQRLMSVVGWGVAAVGGWWCGWMLGGTLMQKRRERHRRMGSERK